MPRPTGGYWILKGRLVPQGTKGAKRAPGMSTIAKMIDDPGGLIYWANQEGLKGNTLEMARHGPMTVGSLIHAMIEDHFLETDEALELLPDCTDEMVESAGVGFRAFMDWMGETKLEPLEAEVARYSPTMGVGGTLDLLATSPTRGLGLIDWKSGKGSALYPSQLIQLRGYGRLVEETDGMVPQVYHIVRFNQKSGDFAQFSRGVERMAKLDPVLNRCIDLYRDRKWIKETLL